MRVGDQKWSWDPQAPPTPLQAPPLGTGGGTLLPGAVEQPQPQFISRFLEGQSGVTIKHVACGDLFTACLTGELVRGVLWRQEKARQCNFPHPKTTLPLRITASIC